MRKNCWHSRRPLMKIQRDSSQTCHREAIDVVLGRFDGYPLKYAGA